MQQMYFENIVVSLLQILHLIILFYIGSINDIDM